MWINSKIRLGTDTKKISTKTGTEMRTGFGYGDCGDEHGFPLGIVAFNKLADALGKYHKSDTIMVSGNIQANSYRNKDGQEVKQWQVVLDGIAGVKRMSPVHNEPPSKEAKPDPEREEFDDVVPF